MNNLYLYLDLFTFLGPLILSFDKRVAFFKHWKALGVGLIVMMLVFIPWDINFTENGIWGFNPSYLTGIDFFGLPLEEWLFFIVVPYACIFIYACTNVYIKKDIFRRSAPYIFIGIAVINLVIGFSNLNRAYTSITCLSLALLLLYLVWVKAEFLSRFLIAYLIVTIPFLIVNGVLTGTGITEEVVWYNNAENLSIRLFTIPIEDTMYNLLMLLLVVIPYNFIQKKAL